MLAQHSPKIYELNNWNTKSAPNSVFLNQRQIHDTIWIWRWFKFFLYIIWDCQMKLKNTEISIQSFYEMSAKFMIQSLKRLYHEFGADFIKKYNNLCDCQMKLNNWNTYVFISWICVSFIMQSLFVQRLLNVFVVDLKLSQCWANNSFLFLVVTEHGFHLVGKYRALP